MGRGYKATAPRLASGGFGHLRGKNDRGGRHLFKKSGENVAGWRVAGGVVPGQRGAGKWLIGGVLGRQGGVSAISAQIGRDGIKRRSFEGNLAQVFGWEGLA